MWKPLNKKKAIVLNERGNKLREAGNWQASVELYEQASVLAPRWSSPQYNLGLVYKYQCQWKLSLEHNRRAVELDPKDEASWWNLGIAATALGDWETARAAWKGFGASIPVGSGPIEMAAGISPIRLNPDGDHPEVVWADRLCPARARIFSIPLPESKHRWRDVVLNDGAPVGRRKYQGQEFAVFNELQRLEESVYGTYVAEVEFPPAEESHLFEALTQLAIAKQIGAEDWTSSIQLLCKACSEGRVHKDHDKELAPRDGTHRIAIAAKSLEEAQAILDAWRLVDPRIAIETVEELVKSLT